MLIIKGFEVGPIAANCYIIGCEETRDAAVIDPGADAPRIMQWLKKLNLNCKYIILTHGHIDHIGAVGGVYEQTGAQVLIHTKDADMLTNPNSNLSWMTGAKMKVKAADRLLEQGDKIQIGKLTIEVIHTPGHTQGGITLKVENNLITGDTLFAGSIGRTDFPGGNYIQLIGMIKTKLMIFPPTTSVFPGHGPMTTIGDEAKYNPFMRM